MQYTVKLYNVSRTTLSDRHVENKAIVETKDAYGAIIKAAQVAGKDSMLASLLGDVPNREAAKKLIQDNLVYEGTEGAAACIDGDFYLLVFPTERHEKELFKQVAMYEAQFDENDLD